MNLHQRLSRRIHAEDILEILFIIKDSNEKRRELYLLIFDKNDKISYQALWVCSHFNSEEKKWLLSKQNELIDAVLNCKHPGKRRLFLTLLNHQSFYELSRIDLLDYCLDRIVAKDELPGVRALCIKLAYKLCRHTPDLLNEFHLILEMMECSSLPVSIRTVRKNSMEAIQKCIRSAETIKNKNRFLDS